MAQEQVLKDEVVARPYPGQGGREYEPEQFKHLLSIADPCSREVLPSHKSTWKQRARRGASSASKFKAETVALIRSSGESIAQLCRDLDLAESVVRRWLAQAEIDAGQREGLPSAERQELARLRKEVRVLREERDILNKAAAFLRQGDDPVSRFRFIAAERASHAVVTRCGVLGVSPSGSYAWCGRGPSVRSRTDAVLLEHIRAAHARSYCTSGAPRIQAELRATGTRVGRKRVARLLRAAGLVGRCPRRFRRTTIPAIVPAAEPPDLVRRDFHPRGRDRLWVADRPYVRTGEGWLYLAIILDAFSRRVVGWALADHRRTELATAALQMALANRQPPSGLIHHSDRGGPYLSAAYLGLLAEHGARSSVGRPATCWENAVPESCFATLKLELLHRAVWPTRRHARTAIFQDIEGFDHRRRRHSALGFRSPADFAADTQPATLSA